MHRSEDQCFGNLAFDVIDQINVNTGNLILVDWASLKLAHITRELPVTMDISNLPVNNALPKLLDAVGARTSSLYIRPTMASSCHNSGRVVQERRNSCVWYSRRIEKRFVARGRPRLDYPPRTRA